MSMSTAALLADAILLLHIAVVASVVLGLVAIVLGAWMGWQWTRRLWFRLTHLAVIAVVVVQAWFGRRCSLTDWEMYWRREAGQLVYGESFIAYWLGRYLYWQGPLWAFALAYTVFAVSVLVAWWRWPPIQVQQRDDVSQ
jgi:hypothetical protein